MKSRLFSSAALAAVLGATLGAGLQDRLQKIWEVHDPARPLPPVVAPAPLDRPGAPPADAVVLFGGQDLGGWVADQDGGPTKWKVEDGAMLPTPKAGYIRTKQGFGDCQLHLEWAVPAQAAGEGQGRGNSGVFLMGRYEVQILDSFENPTYADGQAAAVYGQNPPAVNASRKPGEWQAFDIVFRRPLFHEGKVVRPATVTVFHNGVLVQDHFAIQGATAHKRRAEYTPHGDKEPLKLQDHGNPVRFRNVWIREL